MDQFDENKPPLPNNPDTTHPIPEGGEVLSNEIVEAIKDIRADSDETRKTIDLTAEAAQRHDLDEEGMQRIVEAKEAADSEVAQSEMKNIAETQEAARELSEGPVSEKEKADELAADAAVKYKQAVAWRERETAENALSAINDYAMELIKNGNVADGNKLQTFANKLYAETVKERDADDALAEIETILPENLWSQIYEGINGETPNDDDLEGFREAKLLANNPLENLYHSWGHANSGRFQALWEIIKEAKQGDTFDTKAAYQKTRDLVVNERSLSFSQAGEIISALGMDKQAPSFANKEELLSRLAIVTSQHEPGDENFSLLRQLSNEIEKASDDNTILAALRGAANMGDLLNGLDSIPATTPIVLTPTKETPSLSQIASEVPTPFITPPIPEKTAELFSQWEAQARNTDEAGNSARIKLAHLRQFQADNLHNADATAYLINANHSGVFTNEEVSLIAEAFAPESLNDVRRITENSVSTTPEGWTAELTTPYFTEIAADLGVSEDLLYRFILAELSYGGTTSPSPERIDEAAEKLEAAIRSGSDVPSLLAGSTGNAILEKEMADVIVAHMHNGNVDHAKEIPVTTDAIPAPETSKGNVEPQIVPTETENTLELHINQIETSAVPEGIEAAYSTKTDAQQLSEGERLAAIKADAKKKADAFLAAAGIAPSSKLQVPPEQPKAAEPTAEEGLENIYNIASDLGIDATLLRGFVVSELNHGGVDNPDEDVIAKSAAKFRDDVLALSSIEDVRALLKNSTDSESLENTVADAIIAAHTEPITPSETLNKPTQPPTSPVDSEIPSTSPEDQAKTTEPKPEPQPKSPTEREHQDGIPYLEFEDIPDGTRPVPKNPQSRPIVDAEFSDIPPAPPIYAMVPSPTEFADTEKVQLKNNVEQARKWVPRTDKEFRNIKTKTEIHPGDADYFKQLATSSDPNDLTAVEDARALLVSEDGGYGMSQKDADAYWLGLTMSETYKIYRDQAALGFFEEQRNGLRSEGKNEDEAITLSKQLLFDEYVIGEQEKINTARIDWLRLNVDKKTHGGGNKITELALKGWNSWRKISPTKRRIITSLVFGLPVGLATGGVAGAFFVAGKKLLNSSIGAGSATLAGVGAEGLTNLAKGGTADALHKQKTLGLRDKFERRVVSSAWLDSANIDFEKELERLKKDKKQRLYIKGAGMLVGGFVGGSLAGGIEHAFAGNGSSSALQQAQEAQAPTAPKAPVPEVAPTPVIPHLNALEQAEQIRKASLPKPIEVDLSNKFNSPINHSQEPLIANASSVKNSVPETTGQLLETPESVSPIWRMTEQEINKIDQFKGLNTEQKVYLIDSLRRKIEADPEAFGLQNGTSLQEGEAADLAKILADQEEIEKLLEQAKHLAGPQIESIHLNTIEQAEKIRMANTPQPLESDLSQSLRSAQVLDQVHDVRVASMPQPIETDVDSNLEIPHTPAEVQMETAHINPQTIEDIPTAAPGALSHDLIDDNMQMIKAAGEELAGMQKGRIADLLISGVPSEAALAVDTLGMKAPEFLTIQNFSLEELAKNMPDENALRDMMASGRKIGEEIDRGEFKIQARDMSGAIKEIAINEKQVAFISGLKRLFKDRVADSKLSILEITKTELNNMAQNPSSVTLRSWRAAGGALRRMIQSQQ